MLLVENTLDASVFSFFSPLNQYELESVDLGKSKYSWDS